MLIKGVPGVRVVIDIEQYIAALIFIESTLAIANNQLLLVV